MPIIGRKEQCHPGRSTPHLVCCVMAWAWAHFGQYICICSWFTLTSLPRVLQLEGQSPPVHHAGSPALAESILQVVFDSSSSCPDLNWWHPLGLCDLLCLPFRDTLKNFSQSWSKLSFNAYCFYSSLWYYFLVKYRHNHMHLNKIIIKVPKNF